MATIDRHTPTEARVLLRGVSWEVYSALRAAPENDRVRMTYDRGVLEMMSPSRLHERWSDVLGLLIHEWALERGPDVCGCGSMTFSREDLEKGLEPDKCYYIEHEVLMRGEKEVDWLRHPPPDLALEVDVTRSSINKLRLYAAFRVPEVWRCEGKTIRVYRLAAEGQYGPADGSVALVGFPLARAAEILARIGTDSETALVRAFRDELRAAQ